MKHISTLLIVLALLLPGLARASEDTPILTIHSNAYMTVGESNLFSFLLGTSEAATYTIVDGLGTREVEVGVASVNPSTGEFQGSWIQFKAPVDGTIKVYGDASKIDVLMAEGAYITSVDMDQLTNLEILSFEHNALEGLDLSPFTRLQAIYLTDNPFSAASPLKIGVPKNDLVILEIDIIEHLDQSFNLSDYPAMVSFDAYHNMDLHSLDPTGCPNLQSLSIEMTDVATLDVSQNPLLYHLNVSESRVTELDLTANPELTRLLASHDSGFVNTDCKFSQIDVSANPKLTLLNLDGNRMTSVDVNHNPLLTSLSLTRNSLTSLDLSANTRLYSVYVMFNDMDYATLPLPQPTWGEYFYIQNPMSVPRAIAVDSDLDLSSRVLRENTSTIARVWRMHYDQESELLDESLYSYADGKIRFNTVVADSVFVEFSNSVFNEYTMTTTPFVVKIEDDLAKPSRIVTLTPGSYGKMSFSVGMSGATPEHPVKFMVDFGDAVLREFEAVAPNGLESANVTGTPTGQVSIWIPEGEVMTSLSLTDVPLASLDVTKATELVELRARNAGLYYIDLRYNRCLTDLDIAGNNLMSLDLQGIYGDYEKNVLATLDASNNQITSFNNMARGAMKHLDLSDNQLEEIVLKDYDNLLTLDLSGNRLQEANLEYMYAATDIDLSDNLLTSVTPCATHMADHVDLTGNNLTYVSLPVPSVMGEGCVYAPQRQITIPAKAPSVNLSAQNVEVEGNPTEFRWYKADGTALVRGTDYTESNGNTMFLDASLGQVYCELTNTTFPMFAGENALRTTETLVVDRPSYVAASFKVRAPGNNPEIIFAGAQPAQVYVDWTGEGDELIAYDVEQMYRDYPVDPDMIERNAEVKVYVQDEAEARNLTVFSVYDISMHSGDFSNLTGLMSLNIGGADLAPEDILMPDANLTELNLSGNRFTSYPYAEKYPDLYMLNLAGNRLTSFDGATIPDVSYLVLSDNQISDVHFNNPRLWNIQLDINSLETIDLSGLPALEQLIIGSNLLSEIDLEPVKNTLHMLSLVGNNFTFATLPVQSEYPRLQVYYYGVQAPIVVACNDMTIDLSAQAEVAGSVTKFVWYAGVPEYDPDTDSIVGNELVEGTDYEISNGVTHFLRNQPDGVLCVMNNPLFPNLMLITDLIALDYNSVDGIEMDSDREVEVYSLQGVLLRKAALRDAVSGLEPGVYVVDGKKVLVK